jgi:hypothetical protein
MKRRVTENGRRLFRENLALARKLWPGQISKSHVKVLERLTLNHGISLGAGDLQLLENRWYVTHSGLLSLAERKRCSGIRVQPIRTFCDPRSNRWVFRAIVFKKTGSKGFAGFGDADLSNTSPLVRGAEMRVAETRAVNRALRKAYGIGLCSVEELSSFSTASQSFASPPRSSGDHSSNGLNNGQPRLRDQLCLLIRQYNLDPTLVKAYAAEFCGTATLKEASRDLVESFISELSTAAKSDRDSLLCKLNSYAQPTEVKQ